MKRNLRSLDERKSTEDPNFIYYGEAKKIKLSKESNKNKNNHVISSTIVESSEELESPNVENFFTIVDNTEKTEVVDGQVQVNESNIETTPTIEPVQVYATEFQITPSGVVPGPANEILKKIDFIEREPGLLSTHLILEDKDTFKFYRNELAKFSGDDMHSTVKEICQNFISDEVLKDFSYMGKTSSKGTKKRFKKFDNLTKVVVLATMQSMNSKYEEIFGIKKILSDKKKQKLYEEIHSYFTKEYFKHATTRFNRVK